MGDLGWHLRRSRALLSIFVRAFSNHDLTDKPLGDRSFRTRFLELLSTPPAEFDAAISFVRALKGQLLDKHRKWYANIAARRAVETIKEKVSSQDARAEIDRIWKAENTPEITMAAIKQMVLPRQLDNAIGIQQGLERAFVSALENIVRHL